MKNDKVWLYAAAILFLGPNVYSLARYHYMHYGYPGGPGNWASIMEIIFGLALLALAIFGPQKRK